MSRFSKEFFIGAATAAHQVEGNNINSDYWAMEHMENTNFNEPSLEAADHYNRYEEDIKMLAKAGLNAYRFSIEWARIEPKQGEYDKEQIMHYRQVLLCCKKYDIEPVVTMMHFTSPIWIIQNGGWENEKTVEAFADYCRYVISELGDLMNYVVTINEANMGIQVAAIAERYKRQMMAGMKKMADNKAENLEGTAQIGMNFNSMQQRMQAQKEEYKKIFGTDTPQTFVSARTKEGDMLVMKAHKEASKAMKEIKPSLNIGLSLSLHDIQALEGGEANAKKEWEDEFLHYLPYIAEDDFFGLQNYSRSLIGPDGICPVPENAKVTQMDYENYPKALANVITRVHREFEEAKISDMPILVTENGIATANDSERIEFIDEATLGVAECINMGIPVKGYFYWSLMDNFEWQKGFAMTFGLISVDRSSMERTKKPSLDFLGSLGR